MQPILQQKGAKKVKNYGKKIATCAEALGLKLKLPMNEKRKEKKKRIKRAKTERKIKGRKQRKTLK